MLLIDTGQTEHSHPGKPPFDLFHQRRQRRLHGAEDDHRALARAAAAVQARELILERMRDLAAEQGTAFEPERPDNVHRLNMGVFPEGARIIPNPYNKIAGFSLHPADAQGGVFFVPGFPVMAWPMIEWVLDTHCAHAHRSVAAREKSVIVFGAMEASLTPLMEAIEAGFPGVKVFSLPSVDHPQWGRHIELGVKGEENSLDAAYAELLTGLGRHGVRLGPELVR
jgi:molybdopterin-biosynthesis enzyme MoeA-like protein